MHFIRKSCYLDRNNKIIDEATMSNKMNKKKHVTLSEAQIEEFDNEEFVFKAPVKYLKGTEDDS